MSIIERFLEDHRAFRRHLEDSLKTAAAMAPGSLPPFLSEEEKIFAQRLRRHARMESEILFPAMQRAGTDHSRQTAVQHFISHGDDEHSSVAKRHAELHSIAEGEPLAKWRTCLEHFIEGLLRHMAHEEKEIFPLALKLLSPSVLIDLNQKAESIP